MWTFKKCQCPQRAEGAKSKETKNRTKWCRSFDEIFAWSSTALLVVGLFFFHGALGVSSGDHPNCHCVCSSHIMSTGLEVSLLGKQLYSLNIHHLADFLFFFLLQANPAPDCLVNSQSGDGAGWHNWRWYDFQRAHHRRAAEAGGSLHFWGVLGSLVSVRRCGGICTACWVHCTAVRCVCLCSGFWQLGYLGLETKEQLHNCFSPGSSKVITNLSEAWIRS